MAYNPDAEPASQHWGDGRMVVRRPEVSDKVLNQSYVIRNRGEAQGLSETTLNRVAAEQQMTLVEVAEWRTGVWALAAKLGIDMETTESTHESFVRAIASQAE